MRGCKGKVSIVLNRNIYHQYIFGRGFQGNEENNIVFNYDVWMNKWIRNCNANLQSLSLTFQSIDQLPTWKHNLRNLRHFSLKFDKDFANECGWGYWLDLDYTFGDSIDKYFMFLFQIIKGMKKLQTLRLDIAPYSITLAPLAYLLLTLDYEKIPDWHIRIGTVSEDFMKIVNGVYIEEINSMPPKGLKTTSEVLEKVDFLGIYVVNYVKEILDDSDMGKFLDYGAFGMSVPRLGEELKVTCKYKKILDVTLTDFSLEKYSINLKKVLSQFPGLEGLYIKAVENIVIFEDNDDFQKKDQKRPHGNTDEFRWTRNLQEAFITFLTISSTSFTRIESQTQSFSNLFEVLKTRCPRLNSLNVFRGHPVFHFNGHMVRCKKSPLIVPCAEITGMSSLTKLEITSDNRGLQLIGKALETLKNLERFKINIVDYSDYFKLSGERNDERIFYEFDERERILDYLPGLKELELIINPSRHSIKWADHFAKCNADLKSLEVLRVINLNEDGIFFEFSMKIIDGLLRKRTLTKVEIDGMIVRNDPALGLAVELLTNLSKKDVESLVMNSLKAKIVKMVEFHPKLELVNILTFKEMEIDQILYDARTRI